MIDFSDHELTEFYAADCRPCDRRRVKCDRSLPTCKKCVKKGLECPGYGLILKWDQGVASRGNLAGKSVPILPQRIASRASRVIHPPHTVHDHGFEGSIISESERSPFIHEQQCVEFADNQTEHTDRSHHSFLFNSNSKLSHSLISFSLPLLQNRTVRRFLTHYDQVLAWNMAWTISNDNPWRSIMMPMAMQSPPLMFSILAFAAKHVSAMANSSTTPELHIEAARYSKRFGRRALELLAEELRLPAEQNGSTRDIIYRGGSSNAVLASMLVLCNVETVWPDSSVWRVHLNAARTVLAARSEDLSGADYNDSISTFLRQELFIANTFASITSFNETEEVNPLAQEPGGVFVDFLKLLQMVTNLERQAFRDSEKLGTSIVTPLDLQILFEQARANTLQNSSSFTSSSQDRAQQFNRIVNGFYHAGLIYSYRALFNNDSPMNGEGSSPKTSEIMAQMTNCRTELFEILEAMDMDSPTYAQDLVFPLFIAGTEASEIVEQEMVVQKLRQAMQGTGFSNCEQAIEFLRAFWARPCEELSHSLRSFLGQNDSWISFARKWATQGHVFLVF